MYEFLATSSHRLFAQLVRISSYSTIHMVVAVGGCPSELGERVNITKIADVA